MPQGPSLLAALSATEVREFLPGHLLAQLRALVPDFRLIEGAPHDEATFGRELAAMNPEILLGCWTTPPLPRQLPPRLRYVCYIAGSVRRLLSRPHLEQGLLVTNWGDSISRTVAECALFHILACLRNASQWAIAMHQPGVAAWKNGMTEARSLFCRRVGLHGFGRVAREFVTLVRPWGCPVSAFAPDLTEDLARGHGIERKASLDALFAGNDVIVELAPLVPATRGIVTEHLLRLIPPGGVFVNVGRGAVVDEPGLERVAREGRIHVGLDVYADEPLSADSAFRRLPNVSLTPHIAGPTIDRYSDAGAFALKNLRAYLEQRPLEAVVTPQTYDQSS